MNKYDQIKEKITNSKINIEASGGVNEDLIQSAEASLGIYFPEDYKMFLKDFGTLTIGAFDVYGILSTGIDEIIDINAVWNTKKWRGYLVEKLEEYENFMVVGELGDGSGDFLKTSPSGSDLGVYTIEGSGYAEKIADSFPEYLDQIWTMALEE